jgi:microcystin-dependent protein
MFPDLFSAIGTTYGAGDGSTTFNLPNYSDGKFPEGSTVAGVVKQPGLPNIEGSTGSVNSICLWNNWINPTGAFSASTSQAGLSGSNNNAARGDISFDASLSNPIYGASNTVQPYSLTTRFVIKAYDGVTPTPAEADISEMLTELTGKADRDLDNLTQAGQDSFLERDFTIIYPNGGSAASPANVTLNTRYVETNPFPGYHVECAAEVLINNQWGITGFVFENGGYGTMASQLDDGDVVIQTGTSAVATMPANCGAPFPSVTSIASAPCRVKVWKVGIPTA